MATSGQIRLSADRPRLDVKFRRTGARCDPATVRRRTADGTFRGSGCADASRVVARPTRSRCRVVRHLGARRHDVASGRSGSLVSRPRSLGCRRVRFAPPECVAIDGQFGGYCEANGNRCKVTQSCGPERTSRSSCAVAARGSDCSVSAIRRRRESASTSMPIDK